MADVILLVLGFACSAIIVACAVRAAHKEGGSPRTIVVLDMKNDDKLASDICLGPYVEHVNARFSKTPGAAE